MPFTLEGRVIPSYAVPDGVPTSERCCPTCPPYVVRCAHDPEVDGRAVWLVDCDLYMQAPCSVYHSRSKDWDYNVMLGPVVSIGCGPHMDEVVEAAIRTKTREEADAVFERYERIMLGREEAS